MKRGGEEARAPALSAKSLEMIRKSVRDEGAGLGTAKVCVSTCVDLGVLRGSWELADG